MVHRRTAASMSYWNRKPGTSFTVSMCNPDNGDEAGGDVVAINGSGFTNGTITVQFGAGNFVANGHVTFTDDTRITVDTPAGVGLGTVDVIVTIDGTSVTLSSGFTYNAP